MQIEAIDIQQNLDGQLIQLPDDFKINDSKVYLKKTGNVIHIIPFHQPWENLFQSLAEFTPDFMDRDQPNQQNRESFE